MKKNKLCTNLPNPYHNPIPLIYRLRLPGK